MQLDVIIPTYNRHDLLERTLASLLAAPVPEGLRVGVTVVDNNSKDATRETVEAWQEKFAGRLKYILETEQGRSPAINAGIRAADGDLVGMIDDDEEIDAGWYARIKSAFADDTLDFIGGPCLPRWGMECPEWLPKDHPGVIGWIDGGDKVQAFGTEYEGILMGGNAVARRALLEKVGLYATNLGRSGSNLMSGEDQDMFERLMAAQARGLYLPDLIIYHYVPPERLTKRYYRRWCFWNGVSLGMIDRRKRAPVAYLAGVPRWLYGRAARRLLQAGRESLRSGRNSPQVFSGELVAWDFVGFIYGKHFYRPSR